ncbi:MAG: Rpn family recombination-promoting nuclease/putative transposase, partial [Bacteroidota bacterium]
GDELILSFLVEHKSEVPDFIYDQLQAYVTQKHEQDRKDKKPRTPVIIILLYHGKKRWVKKPPHAYFKGLPKALRRYVGAPDYFLIDIGRFNKKKIMGLRMGYLVNALLVLKYAFNPIYLGRSFKDIFVYGDFYDTTQEGQDFIHALLVYFLELTNFDEKKSIALVEKIKASYKRTAMTSYQNILKAGKKEGKIEGKVEGKEEVAERLLLKFPDWSDFFLSELTGLPEEKIKAIRAKLATGQNGKSANGAQK